MMVEDDAPSMSASAEVGVFGAGGLGRELVWECRSDPRGRLVPVCYIDDQVERGRQIGGLDVLALEMFRERHPDARVLIAIAESRARANLADRVARTGAAFATSIHDSVRLSPSIEIGPGSIVSAGCRLTVDIVLGAHVQLNLCCTVGHDVRIDEFATLAPGVHVSGNVHIGRGAFIGTGASIVNGLPDAPLVIGAGSVVGAGACVTGSVEEDTLYVGVPARAVKRIER